MGIFGRSPSKPPPGVGTADRAGAQPPKRAEEDPLSTLWSHPPIAPPSGESRDSSLDLFELDAPDSERAKPPSAPEPTTNRERPAILPVGEGSVLPNEPPPARPAGRVPPMAAEPPPSSLVASEPEPMTVAEALGGSSKQTTPTAPEQLRLRRPPMPAPPSGPPRMSPIPPRASSAPPRISERPPRISSGPPAARDPSIHPAADPVAMMRLARGAGDHHTALVMAESILAHEPGHADAVKCAAECRDRLFDGYSRRLGARSRTLRIIVTPDKIPRLTIDHRSAFLLSRIDGVSSIDEVLDVSGMPMLDAMRVLVELLDQRLVVPDDPPPSREPGRIPR